MCNAPDIPEPTRLQSARSPVYRDSGGQNSTGRRSTILTGSQGVVEEQTGGKKTILGQ